MGYFLASSGLWKNSLFAVLVISHHCVSLSTRRCHTPGISRSDNGVIGTRSNDRRESWQCQQTMSWRNLGEKFFPRFITEVRCSNSTCLGGQAFCRPVNINMKVLTANNDTVCADSLLPAILRSRWTFQDISVTAHFCLDTGYVEEDIPVTTRFPVEEIIWLLYHKNMSYNQMVQEDKNGQSENRHLCPSTVESNRNCQQVLLTFYLTLIKLVHLL